MSVHIMYFSMSLLIDNRKSSSVIIHRRYVHQRMYQFTVLVLTSNMCLQRKVIEASLGMSFSKHRKV
jgi:hypothetical protein